LTNLLEGKEAVKCGTWLYDGSIPCEVRIVRHDTLYGSGDHADPREISEDQNIECFYILFRTPVGAPAWVGGGVALSIDSAMLIAETTLGAGLIWRA
jgi:hypothetical protein